MVRLGARAAPRSCAKAGSGASAGAAAGLMTNQSPHNVGGVAEGGKTRQRYVPSGVAMSCATTTPRSRNPTRTVAGFILVILQATSVNRKKSRYR